MRKFLSHRMRNEEKAIVLMKQGVN